MQILFALMTESMFKSEIKLPCPPCPTPKSLRTFWGKPGRSSVTPATQAMVCSLCCPQADVSTTSDHAQADWRIAFPLRLSGCWIQSIRTDAHTAHLFVVTSKDVFNMFCNCLYVCVGCGFVCFPSISFSLFFLPRHMIGISISCVQSVMPAVIGWWREEVDI